MKEEMKNTVINIGVFIFLIFLLVFIIISLPPEIKQQVIILMILFGIGIFGSSGILLYNLLKKDKDEKLK